MDKEQKQMQELEKALKGQWGRKVAKSTKTTKERVSEGIAHIHASFNNTLINITDN